ncbi:MAG TPA: PepSY domain-containing protein [Gammaproteobacteria bacterium]|nr:PepSY domain-containing protein [Gammaproteobacteria bacterium]
MSRSAPRTQRWFPRFHRWLGLGCLLFVLLLSGTGVALNHSAGLELDSRYVRAEWLLRWFGIGAPAPAASFLADGHSVTVLGARLYFDDVELADGITDLVGAVATARHVAIATASQVLLVSREGVLVEQLDAAGALPAPIVALGRAPRALVFETRAGRFRTDEDVLEVAAWPGADGPIEWAVPQALAPERLERLAALYRGRGLSLERLLLELHSGRILGRAGTWLMDLVGVALAVLSVLGLLLWLQRRPRQRR